MINCPTKKNNYSSVQTSNFFPPKNPAGYFPEIIRRKFNKFHATFSDFLTYWEIMNSIDKYIPKIHQPMPKNELK